MSLEMFQKLMVMLLPICIATLQLFTEKGEVQLITKKEGYIVGVLRIVLNVSFMISILAFVFHPETLSSGQFQLPELIVFLGALVALISAVVMVSSFQHLRNNFSGSITIKARQQLVTTGPYRYVRHPIYLSYFLWNVANIGLTQNAIIVGLGFSLLGLVIFFRLAKEESLLLGEFGEEYVQLKKRTGAIFPKLV